MNIRAKVSLTIQAAVLMMTATHPVVAAKPTLGSNIPSCSVTFTAPSKGSVVGSSGTVSGKARLPPKSYLWVLARRADLPKWWPQGLGAVVIRDGEWRATVGYGGKQDIGFDFEIALAVVGEDQNRELDTWIETGQASHEYPPIRFPQTAPGCVPEYLIVKKGSH